MDDSVLKELVPLVGPRVKFKVQLELWKNSLIESQILAHNTEKMPDESHIIQLATDVLNDSGQYDPSEYYPTTDLLSSASDTNSEVSNLNEPDFIRFNSAYHSIQPINPTIAVASTSTKTIIESDLASHSNSGFCKGFVEEILKSSVEGQALLKSGQQSADGRLLDTQRKLLGRLIIQAILQKDPNRSLSQLEYTQIGLAINSIFKQEPLSLYYTVCLDHTPYTTKRIPRGILYSAWVSRRRRLRQLGQIKYTPRGRANSTASTSESASPRGNDLHEVDSDDLQTLRSTTSPWETIGRSWKNTSTLRLNKLQGDVVVADYFKEFPPLKLPEGYELLLSDFDYLYPGKEHSLTSSLQLMRDQIIKIASAKADGNKTKDLGQTVAFYLEKSNDQRTDSKSEVALLLLPYTVSLQPCRKKGGKIWRPSRSEVRDGFITHVPSNGDVRATVQQRKEKLARLGRTFQPLVIIIGESVCEYTNCFVVVDDTYYSFNTLLKAVDTAFKIFHATGAKYPDEAEDVWLLVQRLFYNITTKYDRLNQSVSSLLTEFNLLS